MVKRRLISGLAALIIGLLLSCAIEAQEKVRVAVSNFSASYIPMVLANKRWKKT